MQAEKIRSGSFVRSRLSSTLYRSKQNFMCSDFVRPQPLPIFRTAVRSAAEGFSAICILTVQIEQVE